MFRSIDLMKAMHDDRVREIERDLRVRRLLDGSDESSTATTPLGAPAVSARVDSRRVARGGSAAEPA
jgi:hypothetical protein